MRKENKGLMILIVILLIAAVVVGALVGYNRAAQNDKKNNIDSRSATKLDDSKDYVYDADYTSLYTNSITEFDRGFNYTTNDQDSFYTIEETEMTVEISHEKQELSDLKVPYININSYDAGVANSELKELYKEYASRFEGCAIDVKYKGGHGCALILTYKVYKYKDILSVLVINGGTATAPVELKYTTYNFDLKTGNKITYDEVITRLGYDKNTLLDKEKNLIKTYMDKKVEEVHHSEDKYDLTKKCGNWSQEINSMTEGNCYEQAYKSLESNTISFFINEKGNLNFIAKPDTRLYQNSDKEIIFTIEK